MSLEFGIGISSHADVGTAGREAAMQALSSLPERPAPGLILVFSSLRFADPRLLRGIRQVTGKVPLIGCTDAGGITTAGASRRCVTVIALAADDSVQFVPGIGRHLSSHASEAGQGLGKMLLDQKPVHAKALLMFPDGLSANGSEILRGVQTVLGNSLPIAGGSAADDFYFQRTFQYFNDEILTDSVPGVLLCGDLSVGVGVRHGWLPLGRPRQVTRASGHILYELDGQPAVSIYEEYLGLRSDELAREPIARMAMTYPMGSAVAGQPEYLLRDAIRVGDAGSLVCSGEVREGHSVRLMIGGYESALEAAQQAAQEALRKIGTRPLKGAFVFCSAARQKMLGSEFQGEIDVIRDALGGSGVHMGGFYTYGELMQNRFHNESVVVMTLGQS